MLVESGNVRKRRTPTTHDEPPPQHSIQRETSSITQARMPSPYYNINTKFNEQQQSLLNEKKISQLEDDEKIFLLRREIDNLKGQLRSAPAKTVSSYQLSHHYTRQAAVLSAVLVVCLALVARFKKSRRPSSFSDADASSLAVEMQDAHTYNAPQDTRSTIEFA